jgi:hypothetical protein
MLVVPIAPLDVGRIGVINVAPLLGADHAVFIQESSDRAVDHHELFQKVF